MKYKIDLHTHSILSYDGMMTLEHYKDALDAGKLDYIAITDHNEIDMAKELQQQLGDRIIVGEEIKTEAGDLIGLFIDKKIPKGVSLFEAVYQIKEQGGLVYVPHPFDKMRSGIKAKELKKIVKDVDIIEEFNARYIYPGGNRRAYKFAQDYMKSTSAGSDSHHFKELGKTYTEIENVPDKYNLKELLSESSKSKTYVTPMNYLNPKRNKFRKMISK
jgi:predicted metal-dependent phosphoesterase TrpH